MASENDAPEVVDPRWLVKALGVSLLAAALLGYLSVCLLVYLGGWQLMLHPSAAVGVTPSDPFQVVRFDAAETGTPRLYGWWIPAQAGGATRTILYLHDGRGSLSDSVKRIELLHRLPVDIFAIDYRGFGQSAGPHPSEQSMSEDAAAGLLYLEETRHISGVIPYGEGLGAVLAARLANAQGGPQAVILDSPDPDAFERAISSSKSRLVPMRLLVRDRFDLGAELRASKAQKLLLADGPFGDGADRTTDNQRFFASVPEPKVSVRFSGPSSDEVYLQAMTRFLDNTK